MRVFSTFWTVFQNFLRVFHFDDDDDDDDEIHINSKKKFVLIWKKDCEWVTNKTENLLNENKRKRK
jgi:hypothetical protein